MRDLDEVFARLPSSPFRRRFRLGPRERDHLDAKGIETVLAHARDFIDQRLAATQPANDGKQTPYRGHPMFIAQHATASCCRSCLARWHGIEKGAALTEAETRHTEAALRRWLLAQEATARPGRPTPEKGKAPSAWQKGPHDLSFLRKTWRARNDSNVRPSDS